MNEERADDSPIPVTFTVTLTALVYPEREAGGFSAEVPALPGCYTERETLDDVRFRLREAAEGWLAAAHDSGSSFLPPGAREGAA